MRNVPLSRLASAVAPGAVLLAGAMLFFRRVLFSSFIIPYDLPGYHLPLAHYAAKTLGSGQLPLWDPYTYCGFPFYANLQAQVFYPPAWTVFALANLLGFESLLRLLAWQVALHVFLGGCGAYLLFRRMGLDRNASLLGGTIFMLGGFFASQTQHLGAICGAAWLPFAWLGVVRLYEVASWRRMAALAVPMALSILAGFPAVTIVVLATSWLVALALAIWRRFSPRALAACAAATVLAALLASVQLLPTRELASLSEARLRGVWSDNAGGVPWQGLVSLVAPNYFGIFDLSRFNLPWNPTFFYHYCGLAGLAMALAALFRRDRPAGLWLTVTLASGLAMMGGTTPAGKAVLQWLPPAAKGPLYPESFSAAFVLGLACLAAHGAARWISPRGEPWSAALVLFTVADLYWFGANRYWNTQPAAEAALVREDSFEGSAQTVAGLRSLLHQTDPPGRIDVMGDSVNWIPAAPILGIPTAAGNDPLTISRYIHVRRLFAPGAFWERFNEVSRPDSPVLDLVNVRYILTLAPDATPRIQHPKLRLSAMLSGHQVYENVAALPRFFLVGRTRRAASLEEAVAILGSSGFQPAREAVVEGIEPLVDGGAGTVRLIRYSAHRVELEVEARDRSFLVTSETWYPGWRAFIDGAERTLVISNGAFRGLPVPEGRHSVEMRFQPVTLRQGAALSLTGMLLTGLGLLGRGRLT